MSVKRETMPAEIPHRLYGKFFRSQKAGEFLPPLEGDEYVQTADGLLITSRTLYDRIEASRPMLVFPVAKTACYVAMAELLHVLGGVPDEPRHVTFLCTQELIDKMKQAEGEIDASGGWKTGGSP